MKQKIKKDKVSYIQDCVIEDGEDFCVKKLEEIMEEIKTGDIMCNKVVVLCLDTRSSEYDITCKFARMKNSEVISLLESTKLLCAKDMGIIS